MPNLDWKNVKAYCPGPDCVRFEDVYEGYTREVPAGWEFTGRMIDVRSHGSDYFMAQTLGKPHAERCSEYPKNGPFMIRAELRKLPEAPKPFVETRTVTFKDVYGVDYIEPPTGYEYTGRMVEATKTPHGTYVLNLNHVPATIIQDQGNIVGSIRAELRKLPEPPKPVKWQFEQKAGERHFVIVPTGEVRAPLLGDWFIADSGEPACCKTAGWVGKFPILRFEQPKAVN